MRFKAQVRFSSCVGWWNLPNKAPSGKASNVPIVMINFISDHEICKISNLAITHIVKARQLLSENMPMFVYYLFPFLF